MRLAPGEKSSDNRENVGQETGWLPMVWKLKWGRIWKPRGLQHVVIVDCGCDGVEIVDVDVRVFSFCPPVSQVQKLLRRERTVGRPVSCSGKTTQNESALASVEPLQR